jgi:anti-sigma B factor antagonist
VGTCEGVFLVDRDGMIDITAASRGPWAVVHVRGELDMATTPALAEACAGLDGPLAVEASGIEFIDSTGLRGLLRLREGRDRFVLMAPSAVVRRLLTLTGLAGSFEVVSDPADLAGSA